MDYFNTSEADLASLGAIHTASEIWNQPSVWASTYQKFVHEKDGILRFRNEILKDAGKIILTGAGTSAYIGYSLEGTFQRFTGITTVSIPTTHLVTHPKDYLDEDRPTLVISFARSGNSPESVAAVKLIDRICESVSHLVITCDEEGQLAQYQSVNPKFNFILPPESNDKSLAMTSSYTSMLLSGLLFARIEQNGELEKQVYRLVEFGNGLIRQKSELLREISKLDFNRAVFLGSGPPVWNFHRNRAFKLQELTDGAIICKTTPSWVFVTDPKPVIDEGTIVVFLFSGNQSVQPYEKDLVREFAKGKKGHEGSSGVSETPENRA